MVTKIIRTLWGIVMMVHSCIGWKAVPANQATYAIQSSHAGSNLLRVNEQGIYLHSVFKFGWCTRDSIVRQYLRKTVNMTLPTWQDANTHYIYLLTNKHTQNFYMQCVVMKVYVPKKYLFKFGRLPVYYCQGTMLIVMLNTIQKFEVHEFYFHSALKLPVHLVYEFYHPPPMTMMTMQLFFSFMQREMDVRCITVFGIIFSVFRSGFCIVRDFATCHDDFDLKPSDGVLKEHTFTWLGFVQYLHVTTGLPHHSKAPRVVLIQKQFAVGTATDLLHLPKNYKLGNIIFGDYERDEEDCGLTRTQVKMGIRCSRAYIEMPLMDITPHPEYSRFGVGNSLALVKLLRPMKSNYVLPICLPSLIERKKKRKSKFVFMVDYISTVPTDLDRERMGKKTLKLYTHRDCRRHRMKTRLGSEGVTHVLCSSGCGVRPGAPIVSHAVDGAFELIGVAAGGGVCARRGMRHRLNVEPPLYVDVYPYMTWIVNVVTAHVMPKSYPQNFMLVDGGSSMSVNKGVYFRTKKKQRKEWRGRTYVVGSMCFKSKRTQRTTSFFYTEKFQVHADPPAKLNVFIKISAGIECTITCARLLLPNRLTEPVVEGVGGYNISVEFNTDWFPYSFYFSLGLAGKNTTDRDFMNWLPHRNVGFW